VGSGVLSLVAVVDEGEMEAVRPIQVRYELVAAGGTELKPDADRRGAIVGEDVCILDGIVVNESALKDDIVVGGSVVEAGRTGVDG
jgi:hypothetical protein